MYLVCKLYLKYLIEKKGKKEKKYNTIGKLREYFAMPLISSKLQNSPPPPPLLMKLKCINVYHIISGTHA